MMIDVLINYPAEEDILLGVGAGLVHWQRGVVAGGTNDAFNGKTLAQ
jgi:hypothetical protein